MRAASRREGKSLAIESRSMEERGRLEKFSLLGGPLHRLGRRLGLVRGETNTVALGLALGLLSWSILLALASIGGVSDRLFSLSAIALDVRLLVVIPLFFLCESSLDPRFEGLCQHDRAFGGRARQRAAGPGIRNSLARSDGKTRGCRKQCACWLLHCYRCLRRSYTCREKRRRSTRPDP